MQSSAATLVRRHCEATFAALKLAFLDEPGRSIDIIFDASWDRIATRTSESTFVGSFAMMRIERTIPTRPAKRALQVYLDSNDYSDLSKAMHDAAHPDAGIFQKLCQLVDRH